MKKLQFLVVILSILAISACGTGMGFFVEDTHYETEDGKARAKVRGGTIFNTSPEIRIARAKFIESQANLNNAEAEQIRRGESKRRYLCFIQNVRDEMLIIKNPETNQNVEIPGGDLVIFRTESIHKNILGKFSWDNRFRNIRLYNQPKVVNGVKVDYGANVG